MNRLLAALDRPRQKQHHEDSTVFQLAAAYAFGIAKGHPFTDGSKRVAITLSVVFLRINGWRFDAQEAETYTFTNALAAGEVEEAELVAWLERSCEAEPFRPGR